MCRPTFEDLWRIVTFFDLTLTLANSLALANARCVPALPFRVLWVIMVPIEGLVFKVGMVHSFKYIDFYLRPDRYLR